MSRSAATAPRSAGRSPSVPISTARTPLALERFFDVPDPRLRVLEELPYQLYAAKVVEGGERSRWATVAPSAESLSRRSTSGWPSSSSRTAARTAPVPRPWTTRTVGETGERGVVDERPDGLARVLGALAAHVELVGDVAPRGRDDPNGGSALVALAARGRDGAARAARRSRCPAGPTTSASSPSIAAIVPWTPRPGASTGSPAASGPVSGSG